MSFLNLHHSPTVVLPQSTPEHTCVNCLVGIAVAHGLVVLLNLLFDVRELVL